jgi:hypothetical protein
MSERPVLIDEQDGPCPYCQEWTAKKTAADGRTRRCDECGKDIPHYPCMSGNGIEGVQPHHYHLRPINGGLSGRVAVRQELCLECYVAHRAKHFPSGPTTEKMLADHEGRRLRDEGRSPVPA